MRCGPTRASATSLPPTTPALSPERPAGALRTQTTPRAGLLPAATTKDQINPGLSLWLDEKRGSGHYCCGEAEAMTAGIEDASVAQFPSKMAELGVDALVKAIKGEKVESLIDSGAALVTKDNMAKFK